MADGNVPLFAVEVWNSTLDVAVALEKSPVILWVLPENVRFPLAAISAAVSVPVIVGLALITNVEPVPVCEATDVALPIDVIGPVRLAFVVTVSASVALAT